MQEISKIYFPFSSKVALSPTERDYKLILTSIWIIEQIMHNLFKIHMNEVISH